MRGFGPAQAHPLTSGRGATAERPEETVAFLLSPAYPGQRFLKTNGLPVLQVDPDLLQGLSY
jgi:hypothetical protein